jgi:1-acyl-sn-glycerol-3-phosphate acyltransferase
LAQVPDHGPLIIACNHINFMEVPLIYSHLQPRDVIGLAKAETWDNPLMAILFDLCGAIPIQRGEADKTAFRSALSVLQSGKILAITPEGTRSNDGHLQRGLPGIVMLAFHSRSPILPLGYYGNERLRENLNRLKRTDFTIRVGKMFELAFPGANLQRSVRNQMIDEIMYQIALLLPAEYRGYYSDLSKLSTKYLNFV